jgi:hypothetical protein
MLTLTSHTWKFSPSLPALDLLLPKAITGREGALSFRNLRSVSLYSSLPGAEKVLYRKQAVHALPAFCRS